MGFSPETAGFFGDGEYDLAAPRGCACEGDVEDLRGGRA